MTEVSRHAAERKIEQALLGLGAAFADCAHLVVYDPDAGTSYWQYEPRTGEESIHIGPKFAALDVPCIEMALRHELLHRSMYHGMGERFDNRQLANLCLDICINRLLLEAYPDRMRKTALAVYPTDTKTTPIALADCTADPLRLPSKLAALWSSIWHRGKDGYAPLNPASLYFRLLRLSSSDFPTDFVASCAMCGERRGEAPRLSARSQRIATAVAADVSKRMPKGSSLGSALSELSVLVVPITTTAVERFLREIKIRKIASETARKVTQEWERRTRVQPYPTYPTRRGLVYALCGLTDLFHLHWNQEIRSAGARLALGMYVDVSGSMTGKYGAICAFVDALKDFPLRVRSFDTAVHPVDVAALAQGRLGGGGGTDFDAPVRDLVEDAELAAGVLFTDGQAQVSAGVGAALMGSGKRLYTVYLLGPGENPPASSLAQYCTESISVTVEPRA
jgi:hypothetical protein